MDRLALARKQLAAGLLVGVVAVFACVDLRDLQGSLPAWLLALAAIGCAMHPGSAAWTARRLERVRSLRGRALAWLTLGVFVAAFVILGATAWAQGRSFVPTWHDHHMYLLQARMLAGGRLWMPAHPMADFFETYYVFTEGVYAAMYFPGAALLHVPGVWLHAPYWLFPLLVSAGVATLLFQIVSEIQDPAGGLLAALGMLAVAQFRFLSIDLMSHTAVMLLTLGMVRAWLAWRKHGDLRWASVAGICGGWAFITRPVDALSFVIPVGAAMAWELYRDRPATSPWRPALRTVGVLLAAAAPFLGLQAVFNYQITGTVLRSPADHYCRVTWGFSILEDEQPKRDLSSISRLPQKQLMYECFLKPYARPRAFGEQLIHEAPRRVSTLFASGAPGGWALLLAPLGLLALGDIRKLVFAAQLGLFLLAYSALIPMMLPHYYAAAAPAVVALAAFGRERLESELAKSRPAVPGSPSRAAVGAWLLVAVAAIAWFPGLRDVHDEYTEGYRLMRFVHQELPGKIQQPAVVLFRYHARLGNSFHNEPVYNIDAAWPDDNPIVKAHDLGGARDREIAAYYARVQPERRFYLFDRQDDVNYRIKDLGTAGEFLAKLEALHGRAPVVAQQPTGDVR